MLPMKGNNASISLVGSNPWLVKIHFLHHTPM